MRSFAIALVLVSLPVLSLSVAPSKERLSEGPLDGFINTLMPEPSHLITQPGGLSITASFSIAADRFRDARLEDAITRSVHRIENRTGISIPPAPADSTPATLIISVDKAGETIQSVDEDEAYSLEVTPANAHIWAATVVAAMRGLATLEQLIQSDANGYFIPAVQIHDTPRFRWRGLMIDCARHFIPVDVLKRTL